MARRLRQKEPAGAAHPGALSSERALHAPEGALNPPLFEFSRQRSVRAPHSRIPECGEVYCLRKFLIHQVPQNFGR
jgi:hypothetical protein